MFKIYGLFHFKVVKNYQSEKQCLLENDALFKNKTKNPIKMKTVKKKRKISHPKFLSNLGRDVFQFSKS